MIHQIRQSFTVAFDLPILFTRGVFRPDNPSLAQLLRPAGDTRHRILPVVDSLVLDQIPGLVGAMNRYADRNRSLLEFVAPPFRVRGGEICKNQPHEVEQIQALVERHRLCRQSFVLAVGGGAVLDAVGFAAATAHRGLRLIRMPTTVLAQNDAGVGVKNGVNAFGRKNFLGTFAPPFGVVNDFDFLDTLPARDRRSGIAEAVKVALIKDRAFFDFLHRERRNLAAFTPAVTEHMIIRCAELHIEHIGAGGDPFEFGSARPLDFGHWSAHKLEELTGGALRHGEAVAIGIALDSLYSYHTGRISEIDLGRILVTLEELGFDLHHWALHWIDVDAALADFREHLGGELCITLLDGIGSKAEVHQMDTALVKKCIEGLAVRHARRADQRPGGVERPPGGSRGVERGAF